MHSVYIQRNMIEGNNNDPWFRKNYVTVKHREDEQVTLEDVRAVFEDIEVWPFSFCGFLLRMQEVSQC